MDHTLSSVALVVLIMLALVGLAIVAGGAYVLVRYRVPLRGVVAAVGALAYLVSPVDAIPEVLFGPFGYVDDGGVLLAAALYVARLIAARRSAALNSPAIEAGGRRGRRGRRI